MGKNSISTNEAWKYLIKKYNILEQIKENGYFIIKASQIKEIKEPRLMAKWDSYESLPEVFIKNNINILPNSRNSYILGNFDLYQEIPELQESVTQMDKVELPNYESIDINNISSESNAINVLILSGILNDFLGVKNNVVTFNGRMGTGIFSFKVNTFCEEKIDVHVKNAQCEIDGGFENDESIIIMEAKNVVRKDFHIRQLYYPFRLWHSKVKKPIRLVFSVYSNMIFRLFEYRFKDINDYSSIELIQCKNYSLQDTSISINELMAIKNIVVVSTDDNMDSTDIPFIQANSMERIISLLENLYDNPMTNFEIAELMNFDIRQSDYYYNAGRYLGLFKKISDDKGRYVTLTTLGNSVFKLNYKDRQLKLVELILKHKIFFEVFNDCINNGEISEKTFVETLMRKFNVCNEGQIQRRASSVIGWIRWMFGLTNL